MRDLIKGAICLSIAVLFFSFITARIHAQVEIQQSQSSNINGVEQSIKTENGKTIVKTGHGALEISGDSIRYCFVSDKCGPKYTLNETDGTITK